jgi:hypothetical protein
VQPQARIGVYKLVKSQIAPPATTTIWSSSKLFLKQSAQNLKEEPIANPKEYPGEKISPVIPTAGIK